jgi:PIN domain nuclease of toxin-antitoxin system
MRALLDTHTLLWWLDGDRRLSLRARRYIQNEEHVIVVSAASAWEISTKVRIGKLPGAIEVAAALPALLAEQGFESLAITIAHALRAGGLPGPHRDPFDRMLIAQAQAEDLPLISNERIFDAFGLRRIW